jgi:hypothetical protein
MLVKAVTNNTVVVHDRDGGSEVPAQGVNRQASNKDTGEHQHESEYSEDVSRSVDMSDVS